MNVRSNTGAGGNRFHHCPVRLVQLFGQDAGRKELPEQVVVSLMVMVHTRTGDGLDSSALIYVTSYLSSSDETNKLFKILTPRTARGHQGGQLHGPTGNLISNYLVPGL